jgi:uroporphyrinogen decarboxylase
MTERERVWASLRHEQPDRCPYQIGFTQNAHARMVEHFGDPHFAQRINNALYGVAADPGPLQGEVEPGFWRDEFGVVWNRTVDQDIGVVDNLLLPECTLDGYEFPDPHAPGKFDGFAERVAAGRDYFVQFAIGFSLFERAWTLRGMENLLLDMIECPEFVDDLLDAICDYNCARVEQALEHEIDAVHFGDDWGSQRGLIMGPDLWRRFIMPRLERQYSLAKAKGKAVTIHSCGKITDVIPDLISIGLDMFNPFQPEVMDVYEMKRVYGDRLSFWGGVSIQQLLPFGTPQEVKDTCRRLMREIGRDGGYVIAPAHAIPGDAKPENIAALMEVVEE